MQEEYELIQYPLISYLNVFINRIIYRRPHRHDEFEFCLCLEGQSRWLVSGHQFEVEPGDLLIINPNEIHEIRGAIKGSTFIFIQFSYSLFQTIFPEMKNLIFDENIVKNSTILNSYLVRFSKQYFASSQKSPFKALGNFFELLDQVLETIIHHFMDSKEYLSYTFKLKRIRSLIEFVEKNFKQNINLGDFAIAEDVSLSYMSRFVKENLNMSFQDYVKELRFNEAKRLMQFKNKSISAISYESGFSDPRYMKEVFWENLNMTPEEYRQQNYLPGESTQKYNQVNSEHIFTRDESIKLLTDYI